jgi:hypothetical protein
VIDEIEHQNPVLGHDSDADDRAEKRDHVERGSGDPERQHGSEEGEDGAEHDGDRLGERSELDEQDGEYVSKFVTSDAGAMISSSSMMASARSFHVSSVPIAEASINASLAPCRRSLACAARVSDPKIGVCSRAQREISWSALPVDARAAPAAGAHVSGSFAA